MKKYLISSYLDMNLGDSLLLESLLNHFIHYDCYVIADNKATYKWIEDQYSNVTVINEKNINDLFLRDISDYIKIGGSIFQHNYWYEGIFRYKELKKIWYYKSKGLKIHIVNCNIGPINSNIGIGSTKGILKIADTISCRDNKSLDFIKRCVNPNKVAKFIDLVFACDMKKHQDSQEFILGISVYTAYIKHLMNKNFQYCQQLEALIDNYYSQNKNLKVKLFVFDTFRNNDFPNTWILYQYCKNKNIDVEIIAYNGYSSIMINEMAKCSLIIGTRFHSIVISIKLQIPLIPVSYSNKTVDFLHDLGYTGPLFSFGEAIENDNESLNYQRFFKLSEQEIQNYSSEAKKHIDFLL